MLTKLIVVITIHVSQTITLHTLNLHGDVCQSHLIKTRNKNLEVYMKPD